MYRSLNPGMVNMKVSFQDLLPIASRHGFGAVEYSPAAIEKEAGLERALDLMGQNGVILSSFALPVSFQGSESQFNDSFPKLEAAARIARDLGCHRCGTYVFSWSDELDYVENFALHVRRLRLCAAVLREYGIALALEFLGPKTLRDNHKYEFIHTLSGMLELCDAIGAGNLGIMLDAYHCHTAGMTATEFASVIRSQKDVQIVHINDAPKGAPLDELPDTLRCLPGDGGGIDLKAFLAALKELDYTGPVLVEPFSEKLRQMSDADQIASLVAQSYHGIWPN